MIRWPKNPSVGFVYVNPNGSKWKWNGKGWVSLRESDVVYLTGPTGPAGADGGSSLNVVTCQFSHSAMDPVDNGVYYIGNIPDMPAQSNTSIASKRVKSLVDGELKQVSIMTQTLGTLGSDEIQSFIINNYTKNEYRIISSDYKHLSSNQLNNYLLVNPLDISNGDELEIIWQVGVFSEAPKLVRHSFNAYIECKN